MKRSIQEKLKMNFIKKTVIAKEDPVDKPDLSQQEESQPDFEPESLIQKLTPKISVQELKPKENGPRMATMSLELKEPEVKKPVIEKKCEYTVNIDTLTLEKPKKVE